MIKAVVFDFDGTIADSFGIILEAFKKLVPEQADLGQAEIDVLRNKPYKDMLEHFNISYFKVPGLVIQGRQMLRKSIDRVEPFPGIEQLLKQLHADGYRLYIISSNSPQNINQFLHKHHLRKYFTVARGNVGLLGKPKFIRGLMKRVGYEQDQVVYIGDEPRDIDAAHKSNVRSIAVTWGFSGSEILGKHQPDALAQSPMDIKRIVDLM